MVSLLLFLRHETPLNIMHDSDYTIRVQTSRAVLPTSSKTTTQSWSSEKPDELYCDRSRQTLLEHIQHEDALESLGSVTPRY